MDIQSSLLNDRILLIPLHFSHIPVRGAKPTNHSSYIIRKEQEEAAADDEVHEPSRMPLGRARSKTEHRRSGERNRAKSSTCSWRCLLFRLRGS